MSIKAGTEGRSQGVVRALVVGNDPALRRELAAPLGALGCTVVCATDLEQARALLKSDPSDLILLDGALGETASVELLREVCDSEHAGRIPVLVLVEDLAAPEAGWIELGAEAVLHRPVEIRLLAAQARRCLQRKRSWDRVSSHRRQLESEKRRYKSLTQVVIPIGIALSAERDFNRLLEMIVLESMAFCNADAGTLYLRTNDDLLTFEITRNRSLGIATGGTTGKPNTLPPLRLFDPLTGRPNHSNVAAHVALAGSPVNIPDAYQAEGFDFAGTRSFDRLTGYRSTSFLACPLLGSRQQVIGVLQLINALDHESGEVIAFHHELEQLVLSMSMLATVALEAYLREAQLLRQLDDLRVEVDQGKKAREAAEITGSSYFQNLVGTVREYRQRSTVATECLPAPLEAT